MKPNFPDLIFALFIVALNCRCLGGGTDLYTIGLVGRLSLLGYPQLIPVADGELPICRNPDDRVVRVSGFFETLIP